MFPFRDMRLISMRKKVNMKLIKRAVVDWLKILVFLLDDAVALLLDHTAVTVSENTNSLTNHHCRGSTNWCPYFYDTQGGYT